MASFVDKLRSRQSKTSSKYRTKASGGSGFQHLLALTEDGNQKSVVVSILPPEIDGAEFYKTVGDSVVVPYRYIYVNGEFFRLKGGNDDPISKFLWNRYEYYKDNGLDTQSIDTPVTRYATIVWCHDSSVDDEAGKPYIVLMPKSVYDEVIDINDDLDDDASMFGLVDVAKMKVAYKKSKGQRFGRYSVSMVGIANVVEDEDDFNRLMEDLDPVAKEFNEKISDYDFDNYDQVVEKFKKAVGLGEWNKYSDGGDSTPAAVASKAVAAEDDLDDEIPEEYVGGISDKSKATSSSSIDIDVDDIDIDDIMGD